MKIKKIGKYRLLRDFKTRNSTSVGTLPSGTVIEITQLGGHKVIGPELYDWVYYDMPVVEEKTEHPITIDSWDGFGGVEK